MKNIICINDCSCALVSNVDNGLNTLYLHIHCNLSLNPKLIIDGNTVTITDSDFVYEISQGYFVGTGELEFTVQDDNESNSFTISKIAKLSGNLYLKKVSDSSYGLYCSNDDIFHIDNNVTIGNKTGYKDGLPGVYVDKQGFLHLQRSGGDPYLAFSGEDETDYNAKVSYSKDTNTMSLVSDGKIKITSPDAGLDAREYGMNKVLWSGNYYMTASHSITLSESVSAQPNGIVLVFCPYADGEAKNYDFVSAFIPKQMVALHPGFGNTFFMGTATHGTNARKYLYISDTRITGNDMNVDAGTSNGITYANNKFVLRHVIGV